MDKSKWQGCVMDRDQNHDIANTSPNVLNKATLFPAIQTKECPTSLISLSYDWTALNNKIDQMNADGSKPLDGTNQTIGLAWAWQALTPGPPSMLQRCQRTPRASSS
jgi:hypothetical protein